MYYKHKSKNFLHVLINDAESYYTKSEEKNSVMSNMWFLQKLHHSKIFDHAIRSEYELFCEILFAQYSLSFYFDKDEAKNAKLNNCFKKIMQFIIKSTVNNVT